MNFESALRDLAEPDKKIPAPRVVTLKPSEWAHDYEGRPDGSVAFGVRVITDADVQTARAEAAKLAIELHPEDGEGRLEAYNDALLRWAVARGLCDPNDVTSPHPYLPLPEDMVRVAFPQTTIRRLFDEIERLQIETSQIFPEATDDELGELAELLSVDAPFGDLPEPRARRARRFARFILDELQG